MALAVGLVITCPPSLLEVCLHNLLFNECQHGDNQQHGTVFGILARRNYIGHR